MEIANFVRSLNAKAVQEIYVVIHADPKIGASKCP